MSFIEISVYETNKKQFIKSETQKREYKEFLEKFSNNFMNEKLQNLNKKLEKFFLIREKCIKFLYNFDINHHKKITGQYIHPITINLAIRYFDDILSIIYEDNKRNFYNLKSDEKYTIGTNYKVFKTNSLKEEATKHKKIIIAPIENKCLFGEFFEKYKKTEKKVNFLTKIQKAVKKKDFSFLNILILCCFFIASKMNDIYTIKMKKSFRVMKLDIKEYDVIKIENKILELFDYRMWRGISLEFIELEVNKLMFCIAELFNYHLMGSVYDVKFLGRLLCLFRNVVVNKVDGKTLWDEFKDENQKKLGREIFLKIVNHLHYYNEVKNQIGNKNREERTKYYFYKVMELKYPLQFKKILDRFNVKSLNMS